MVWLWFGKVLQVCFPYRQKLHVLQCGNRFYGALTFCLTLSTTLMLVVCVFSDCWEISVYDLASIYNLTVQAATQDRTTCRKMVDQLPSDKGILLKSYQISSEVGWSAKTSAVLKNASIVSNVPVASSSVSCPNIVDGVNDNVFTNGSVVLPETGGIWRLCLQMSDGDRDFLRKICGQVYPQKCFYYLYETYTLCCKKCQYTVQEFNDLDDMYLTPYGTHYSTISFVFVSLLLHCVCYVLISIVAYKRIVTVVMMTGILFVLSGIFLGFALAANTYKIRAMNQYDLVLPHVTPLMASNRDVTSGWSMTVGWCTLLFSCLTCIIWIKLSYQLASNGSSKVLPTTPLMPPVAQPPVSNNHVPLPIIQLEGDSAGGGGLTRPLTGGPPNSGRSSARAASRMVSWAKRRVSRTNSQLLKTMTQNGGTPSFNNHHSEGLV